MVIDPSFVSSLGSGTSKIHRHTYRFVRVRGGPAAESYTSLLSGHVTFDDAVSFSVELELLALARGSILHLSLTEVTLELPTSFPS